MKWRDLKERNTKNTKYKLEERMKIGMKKFFLVMVILTMAFTPNGIYATNFSTTKIAVSSLDSDVKIELIQNEVVVETGTNTLTHTRNYMRSSTKTNGDEIVITAPKGVHYLMVQLDTYCGMPKTTGMAEKEQVEGTTKPSNMSSLEYGETLVYLMNGEFHFVIPGISGTDAGGTSLGGGNWPYDSRAFSTSGNTEKIITARIATEEEINARRNLALNPFDLRGNDNGLSTPNKKGDIDVFPHAFTNRITDNKREFEPRNAIDGLEYNASHVGFPYQAWGCGNENTDSEFSVLFGRYVEIDQIDITVRAQWNPPQPNNANDHDINWASATLEFSDGTEMPITLQKLASPQTIKLPEKKIVSWVRLKDLPISEEIIPVDGRKKFSALTQFKVWGTEADTSKIHLPNGENLEKLAKKVNDYWIKTGGNTGSDPTNYNHGHSVSSEFWAPSVFYTGNMEAYYLTGDENYTDYANRWGSHNIYNDVAWNTKADTGRTGKYFPDNHTSFQTYLDMFSITSNTGFNSDDEKIRNVVPIMNEMEQMSISDLKNKNGYWDRIDFFYMELPNWTKMYLLTGDQKWLDKLRLLYNDRKDELYDEETGLFYRDKNYIFDANATYNPNSDGNNQKISPNGKKILWSRGNGWAMASLTKILQDLPDDRTDDRKEYETVFKKMAETLMQEQGEDGFWRMNLNDYHHDERPETSGTLFFAYSLAWGINNGVLDKATYYPAVQKAFLGLHANAIRPDGLVGRSELISAYPNPKCSLGIGSSQSYAPAATVLFLSELSKMENQGYVTDDVEPALNKKMIGSIAVKEDSKYAVVNSRLRELVAGTELKTINQNGKVYVPKDFIKEIFGEELASGIMDTTTWDDVSYVALAGVMVEGSNRKLSMLENNISIISYKTRLFNPTIDSKLMDLIQVGLTNGAYPTRPEYSIRFDYTEPPEPLTPSENALIAREPNSSGAISASRLIGPNTEKLVHIEFDMISTLSPSQTNAIVGIGNADSNYTAYSQVPIIIRMYKDGSFGAYNGTSYVQSSAKFKQNEKYHIRVSIDLEEKVYSVFITAPNQEEVKIASDFAFRTTAAMPTDIGKIYLFNNDQAAGKYWLEDIDLQEPIEPLIPSKDALVATNSSSSGAISTNRLVGPSKNNLVNIEFDMVTILTPSETNAIVGIGNVDSNYTSYSQMPIIIRMYKDGSFGAYNGTGYVQSSVKFTENTRYHIRISIDLEAEKYSVFVTTLNQEEVNIATDFAFRTTAIVPTDIGKIYLVNNDQVAGKYWLEDIFLGIKTDKDNLEKVIIEAKQLKETDYTKDSFTNLIEAIIVGENVLVDNEATQEEVNIAIESLETAINNLISTNIDTNKEALERLIERAKKITEEELTNVIPIAVNEFKVALATAETILVEESVSQGEVTVAFIRLSNAIAFLDSVKGNKSELQNLVDQIVAKNSRDYTEESWAIVLIALEDAHRVLDDENAMQAEIDCTKDILEEAFNKLIKVVNVDKSLLEDLVNKVHNIKEKAYIKSTWIVFIEALQSSQYILIKETATQTEVYEAYNALQKAFLELKLKPNTDKLKELINQAEQLNPTIYTIATWTVLTEALDMAKLTYANPDSSQEDVTKVEANLIAAIDALTIQITAGNDQESDKTDTATENIKTGDINNINSMVYLLTLSILTFVIMKKRKSL